MSIDLAAEAYPHIMMVMDTNSVPTMYVNGKKFEPGLAGGWYCDEAITDAEARAIFEATEPGNDSGWVTSTWEEPDLIPIPAEKPLDYTPLLSGVVLALVAVLVFKIYVRMRRSLNYSSSEWRST